MIFHQMSQVQFSAIATSSPKTKKYWYFWLIHIPLEMFQQKVQICLRKVCKNVQTYILSYIRLGYSFKNNHDFYMYYNSISVICDSGTKNWRHSLFWKYLCIRVVLDVLRASSLMLFEGALIVTIKEQVNENKVECLNKCRTFIYIVYLLMRDILTSDFVCRVVIMDCKSYLELLEQLYLDL